MSPGIFAMVVICIYAILVAVRGWRWPSETLDEIIEEAEIYIAYGKNDEALKALRRALDRDPHSPEVRHLLSELVVEY